MSIEMPFQMQPNIDKTRNVTEVTIPQIAYDVAKELEERMDWTEKRTYYTEEICNPKDVMEKYYDEMTSKMTANAETLLEEVGKILKEHGKSYDLSNFLIENHIYKCNGEKVETPFAWHQDDDGGIAGPVYTFLFYIRKDEGIEGGDLLTSRLSCDPSTYKNKEIDRIKVHSGLGLLMSGDTWHCPEDMVGEGERHLLVVQIKRV